MQYAVGVDLGGTKTAAGVVSGAGDVLFSHSIPTLSRGGGAAILDSTARLITRLIAQAETADLKISGVGVGSAGVIDSSRGAVLAATEAIHDWAGTELTSGLSARLQLSPERIYAVNDVHAHALGEAWVGASAGTSSSLLVAFGTGVGGSFLVAGQPIQGRRYVGGHVGHVASPYAYQEGMALPCVCGGAGHVEAIASGPALSEAYLRLGGSPTASDARAVFALAANGDPLAIRVIGTGAAAAGQALGGLANILDPAVVVVSGGLANAGAPWWRPMERALRNELLPSLAGLPVLHAALGTAAALVGAAALVFSRTSTAERNTRCS